MTEAGKETPAAYLEKYIFPVLLSGIEETLQVAKRTERRKCFNPLDHLSAYLYSFVALFRGVSGEGLLGIRPVIRRENVAFEDIPFVKEEWSTDPRPSLPLSATLTEVEAATLIQSYFRGYLVRKESNIQVFRTWQRKVGEERQAAHKIQKFWRRNSTAKPATLPLVHTQDVGGSLPEPIPEAKR